MAYFTLLLPLTERMVIIWFAAYVFSQSSLFWNIIKDSVSKRDRMVVILFFSLLSIAGTYLGIPIEQGAIANIRPLGAIVAGIIGGPVVGASVGLISGLHRWSLGGITGFACGVATIAEGLSGAAARKLAGNSALSLKTAVIGGVLGEVLQVLFVLALTRPYEDALRIEQAVGLPMIVVNTVGVVGFMMIVRDVYQKYNGILISQFGRFVEIEKRLSVSVREELTAADAEDVLSALTGHTDLKGIFFVRGTQVLSYRGLKGEIDGVVQALSQGDPLRVSRIIHSSGFAAPIQYYCVPVALAGSTEPLVLGVQVFGRSYYDKYVVRFAEGLAGLISNQNRTFRLIEQEHEMSSAQLKALKAQIRPHFLFNSLSTISSFCRTNPMKARDLILDLSSYFRRTIESDSDLVPFSEELALTQSYLRIEEARMGDRLQVAYEVPEAALDVPVPTFVVQPLVENAVKYGVAPQLSGGRVLIRAVLTGATLRIEVADNGTAVCDPMSEGGCGLAVRNIRERLQLLYGDQGRLDMTAGPQGGMTVAVEIPIVGRGQDENPLHHH